MHATSYSRRWIDRRTARSHIVYLQRKLLTQRVGASETELLRWGRLKRGPGLFAQPLDSNEIHSLAKF
jgi:hypothetical protein